VGGIQYHEGEYVILEVAKWYAATFQKCELVNFLDIAYQVEYELSGVYPFQGKKKASIIYDPNINWAHSGLWVGLPIHFGKGWFVEGKAPWFGFLHEMGHDFQTGAIQNFSDLIVHQDTGIPIYSGFVEGFASIAYFYAGFVFKQDPQHRGISPHAFQQMIDEVHNRRSDYLHALQLYEENGNAFDRINPDMVDGMLITILDKYGWEKLPKFFRYFHEDGPISKDFFENKNGLEQRVTIIIAALSAAMESDLSPQFQQWNFPIIAELHETLFNRLLNR